MSNSKSKITPAQLGYRMPAEWEPQEAVWLSWPYNLKFWGDETELFKIENIYAQWVQILAEGQKIRILVPNRKVLKKAQGLLQDNRADSNVSFYPISASEIYIRDYGPTFVVKGKQKAMVSWTFNAWGNKYEDSLADDLVPEKMNEYLHLPIFSPGIVLEGGSIDVNGLGTVMVTEQCLLNKNRNPNLGRRELEDYLRYYLGVSKVLWLGEGLKGDDTDGHIDDLARFVNPTTVLCAYEEDHNNINYPMLRENYERLLRMTDQSGKKLDVVKLPMAGVVQTEEHFWTGEQYKPASYANFYIGNSAVVVPIFGHENDELALKRIKQFFPERKVIGIDCMRMVYDGGTLHCASQQEPRV